MLWWEGAAGDCGPPTPSYEDLLLDSSEDEEEERRGRRVVGQAAAASSRKGKRGGGSWIKEGGGEEPVNFLDLALARRIVCECSLRWHVGDCPHRTPLPQPLTHVRIGPAPQTDSPSRPQQRASWSSVSLARRWEVRLVPPQMREVAFILSEWFSWVWSYTHSPIPQFPNSPIV